MVCAARGYRAHSSPPTASRPRRSGRCARSRRRSRCWRARQRVTPGCSTASRSDRQLAGEPDTWWAEQFVNPATPRPPGARPGDRRGARWHPRLRQRRNRRLLLQGRRAAEAPRPVRPLRRGRAGDTRNLSGSRSAGIGSKVSGSGSFLRRPPHLADEIAAVATTTLRAARTWPGARRPLREPDVRRQRRRPAARRQARPGRGRTTWSTRA